MEKTIIRKIKTTDYNDVYLLNQELGYSYAVEKVKEKIVYITKNTKDIILVAEHCNEVIGYIHGSEYELLYSDSLINILGFVVKEKFRHIGVGNELINAIECFARKNGYTGIRLSSGINRLNAHNFYIRHGYICNKEQKKFIKIFD